MKLLSNIFFKITVVLFSATSSATRDPHVIKFRSPNLYPESVAWDPISQHFIVGSFRNRSFHSISVTGDISTIISDPSLPSNSIILGLAVDPHRRRLLAAITSSNPPFNALAAYDLISLTPLFLSQLPSDPDKSSPDVANDVTIDSDGNAYVTNSGNNFIWKVDPTGKPSFFSKSPLFTKLNPVDPNSPYNYCGINGIQYVDSDGGYLLAVQSNSGKLFKIDLNGSAVRVVIEEDMYVADGIALRTDGAVVIVSPVTGEYWVVESDDGFTEGRVVEKKAVDKEGFPTAVVVGEEGRVYLLFGHVEEGMMGNAGRELFRIEEVTGSGKDDKGNVWIFVLIGFGVAYFFIWRFQMRQLVNNMDKKIN